MKKNIVIAILLIIVILMGGTTFYLYTNKEKIFDKCPVEEAKDNTENKEQIEKNNFDLKNKSLVQALSGNYYTIYISKEGDAFLTVRYDNQLTDENVEHLKKIESQYKSNTINGYCNTDGDLRKEICENEDNVESIKLDTENVIAAYDTINGQDVDSNKIIFLKNDGTIDALNIGSIIWSNQDIIVQKNVGDLKNIVTIAQSESTGVPSGSKYALAIENDGTQHILSEYLNY